MIQKAEAQNAVMQEKADKRDAAVTPEAREQNVSIEEKAEELREVVDTICGGYHIYKDEKVLEKAKKAAGQIRDYCGFFLQGNIFDLEETEYRALSDYVVEVLEDYLEAADQGDTVLMLDTLDYGLRELLDIYTEKKEGTSA